MCRGGGAKWVPTTAFLVCNVFKATVVVFTDSSWDIIQRRNWLFSANAKRRVAHVCVRRFS